MGIWIYSRMNTEPILVNPVINPMMKILFLGYSPLKTIFINELIKAKCEIWHTENNILSTAGYDLIVSYGYKHIIKDDVIKGSIAPIINLHMSYLPWNRGAHPNFWSFYDNTPIGVTIHLIDANIDEGPILYQKNVVFTKDEVTFSKTYQRLLIELEILFKENIHEIITKEFIQKPQIGKGSFHRKSDLPREFNGWDSSISIEIKRLHNILK